MNFRKLTAACLCLSFNVFHAAALPLLAEESGKSEPPKFKISPDFDKATMTEEALQKAVEAIDKLAQKEIDEGAVPGMAISIVHKDKIVFAKGYGSREMGKPEKVDADTVFQLASISKAIAGTVVAEAVGEKIVSWDSKISDLDPGFALSEPFVTANLTIKDLFCHRSGLPSHAGDILEDMGYSQAEALHRLRYQMPSSSFRSSYAYTNFGLTEGGLATAKAANTTWEALSENKLYKPLGMASTSSRYSDFWGRSNKAVGHMLVDGKWKHVKQRMPDAQTPAGGVSSSVNDMSKWMRLQLAGGKFEGKTIVDESALAEAHYPQMRTGMSPINGLPDFYGLGFNVSYDKKGRLVLGHSGAFALGAGTNVKMIPCEELGVCVLTNGAPIGVAEAIGNTFMDTALYGAPTQDWLTLFKQIFADPRTLGETVGQYTKPPKSPQPALANSVYTGTYENDFYGQLKVTESANGLSVTIGKTLTSELKHFDRDTFTYEVICEDLTGPSGVIFTPGADGKALTVLVENLDGNGQGTFTRSGSH